MLCDERLLGNDCLLNDLATSVDWTVFQERTFLDEFAINIANKSIELKCLEVQMLVPVYLIDKMDSFVLDNARAVAPLSNDLVERCWNDDTILSCSDISDLGFKNTDRRDWSRVWRPWRSGCRSCS